MTTFGSTVFAGQQTLPTLPVAQHHFVNSFDKVFQSGAGRTIASYDDFRQRSQPFIRNDTEVIKF